MESELLLQTPILVLLFSDILLLIMGFIALFGAVKVIKYWDFKSYSQEQYKLEKTTYLTTLIITITLIFSIALLPYFAFSIDSIHTIVPGAMCGAGVIGANEYGYPLLWVKIALIFLSGIWLVINEEDLRAKDYPYIFKKYYLFIVIFALLLVDIWLELSYFSNISLKRVVSCCSVIFGASGESGIPFNLDIKSLLIIFYLLAILNIYNIWQKSSFLLAISSLAFLPVAYYAIIYFFGTYIYEIPTHICPFCMLQGEYYYIGYIIWGLLLVGTFYSIINAILKIITDKEQQRYFNYSLFLLLALLIITALYVLSYIAVNGVML
jgi:hypothetical protein